MTGRDQPAGGGRERAAGGGTDQATGGKDAFIAELRTFHEACGKPFFKQLAAISERLPQLYPPPEGVECRFVTLSVSAISEVLAGKRKHLPSFDWIASFVLCCQRWALEVGASSYDPGTRTLPFWARRRAACSRSSDGGTSAQGEAGDLIPPPRRGAGPTCTVRPPPHQRAFLEAHGPYGRTLVHRAQAGHRDAVYQMALLLGTDPARRRDAEALLVAAAAALYTPAVDLLEENPTGLPSSEVARHAFALAQEAEAGGCLDRALAFYWAAARGGVPGAAGKAAEFGAGQLPAGPDSRHTDSASQQARRWPATDLTPRHIPAG